LMRALMTLGVTRTHILWHIARPGRVMVSVLFG
jgi:hypothetical protein